MSTRPTSVSTYSPVFANKPLIPNNILISGTKLTIARLEDGSIIIVESGTNLSNRDNNSNYDLTQWFKQQNQIDIESVDLTWVDRMNRKPAVLLRNTNFTVTSFEDEIILEGNVTLDQSKNLASLYFKADLFGDITTSDWSGTIIIDGDNINPALIINQLDLFNFKPGSNLGQGRVQSKFSNAKLNQLTGDFVFQTFAIRADDAENILNDVTMDVDLLRRDQGWVVRTGFSYQETENNQIAVTKTINIETNVNETEKISETTLQSQQLDIDVLAAIMKQYVPIEDYLDEFAINSAAINNLNVIYRQPLKGSELEHHHLEINADQINVLAPKYYPEVKQLTKLDTHLLWDNQEPEKRHIKIEQLSFASDDFEVNAQAAITPTIDQDEKHLYLTLSIPEMPLAVVPKYLPKTNNKPLEKWVNKSLKGGISKNIQLTIDGPLSKFPFKDTESGVLRLTTEVEDAEVMYQDEWPLLTNGSGTMELNGTQLDIQVATATILETDMKDLEASIPVVFTKKPKLMVSGDIATPGEQLRAFINNSPMQKRKSLLIVNDINLKGPTQLNVSLDIPLYPEDKTKIDGHINFQGNSIHHKKFKVAMKDIRGRLDFTRHRVWAKGLQAKYTDRDVTLTIPKVEDSKSSVIIIRGEMDKELISQQLQHYVPNVASEMIPYLQYLSGSSGWETVYDLSPDRTDKILKIRSDLRGIALNFPAPLNKPAADKSQLEVSIPLSDTEKNPLIFRLDERLVSTMTYTDGKDSKLLSMLVNFDGQTLIPEGKEGIKLSGTIPYLDLPAWLDTIPKGEDDGTFNPQSIFQNKQAQLKVGLLNFYGYEFPSLETTVRQQAGDWSIQVASERIAGDIALPRSLDNINLNLQRLELAANENNSSNEASATTASVPDITASVDDFIFLGAKLGKLDLITERSTNEINIKQLNTTNPAVTVNATGSWQDASNPGNTNIVFDVEANSVNELMGTLGWEATSIKDGKLVMNMDAKWAGSPQDYSLEKVSGDANLSIEKGTMLDIDPKAGRLVSLFSIQSLPRRLTLDFSDLVDEGLQFDSITGHLSVSNGNAYTNDLVILSPTAKIAINGRTGLVDQDYDQVVTVTPKISGNLPVAGALFGPIGIGLGTAIYFAGELFDEIPDGIDNLAQIKYTVSGPWDEPVIEDYGKEEKPSENKTTSSIREAIKK